MNVLSKVIAYAYSLFVYYFWLTHLIANLIGYDVHELVVTILAIAEKKQSLFEANISFDLFCLYVHALVQTEEVGFFWLALEVLRYKNSHVSEDSEVTLPKAYVFNTFIKVSHYLSGSLLPFEGASLFSAVCPQHPRAHLALF